MLQGKQGIYYCLGVTNASPGAVVRTMGPTFKWGDTFTYKTSVLYNCKLNIPTHMVDTYFLVICCIKRVKSLEHSQAVFQKLY